MKEEVEFFFFFLNQISCPMLSIRREMKRQSVITTFSAALTSSNRSSAKWESLTRVKYFEIIRILCC